MKNKYEYKMACFNGMTSLAICEELNKLGKDGWKLISQPQNISCKGINTELDMWVFIRKYSEINMITE